LARLSTFPRGKLIRLREPDQVKVVVGQGSNTVIKNVFEREVEVEAEVATRVTV
jgi:hypothetical protein